MRLFVAIELDDDAREAFAVEQARLRAAVGENGGPTWIAPHRLHLTLAFLGEVAEPRASEVVRIIARPISAAPFTLAFGGLGVFPPRGAPRVIWVGVDNRLGRSSHRLSARWPNGWKAWG